MSFDQIAEKHIESFDWIINCSLFIHFIQNNDKRSNILLSPNIGDWVSAGHIAENILSSDIYATIYSSIEIKISKKDLSVEQFVSYSQSCSSTGH